MLEGKRVDYYFKVKGYEARTFSWSGNSVGVNKWVAPSKKRINGRLRPILIRTKEYKEFVDSMTIAFISQNKGRPAFAGKCFAYISTIIKISANGKAKDHDAITKPVFDALEHAGVVVNDSQVSGHVQFSEKQKIPFDVITLSIFEMLPEPPSVILVDPNKKK
jgi:Holliday junction resolvase RusA-like endonuclease